ncbi:MAG: radical SAM protein [Candidatus Omnitrophica bacterium]|nr:radical SAM protein [Candidatus Omnitrophota bacterium]
MKILFVFTEISVKFGIYGFQHGIAAISAYLKSLGYNDIRLCCISPRFTAYRFRKILSNFQPNIIGFYTTCDQFRFIKKLLQEINDPSIFTICGGPHATLNPEIIYESSRLNAVCIGEGEQPFLELLKTLERKEKPLYIKNLWIRNKDEIIKNKTRPFMENINELPFVDRDLFVQNKIWNRIGLTQISYKNSFRISRGCPYQCSFCSNKQIAAAQPGCFLRFRSTDNVLAEIETIVKMFSPPEIYFEDDTFTINEIFIDEFCKKYPHRIGLPFEFFAHINNSTIGILEKIRKAGGRRVSFGIESGNEELRKNILGKTFYNKEIVQVFKEAKRMGYCTEAFVMIGLPGETPEYFNDTIRLLKTIQPDLYSLSAYFPFQGTDLYKYCIDKNYILPNFKIPDKFVSRRDTLLTMPCFSRNKILGCVRAFGWEIYKNHSFKKALLFRVYESRFGDLFLRYAVFYKKLLRKLIIGS